MKQAYSATKTLANVLTHHLSQPPLRGFDQDGAERWQAILQKLNELAAPVISEVERIMNNPYLTDQGKSEAALKIGPRVVGNFKNIGIVMSEAEKARARLEQVIFSPLTAKPEGNEVVVYLREDSIRRSIGKGQAGAAFLEAVEKGNTEMARAILDWPGGHGLSREIERRAREVFALKTAPEAWGKLEFVGVLKDSLTALAQQVAAWLLLLGASPADVQKATGIAVPQSAKVMQLSEQLKQTTATEK